MEVVASNYIDGDTGQHDSPGKHGTLQKSKYHVATKNGTAQKGLMNDFFLKKTSTK